MWRSNVMWHPAKCIMLVGFVKANQCITNFSGGDESVWRGITDKLNPLLPTHTLTHAHTHASAHVIAFIEQNNELASHIYVSSIAISSIRIAFTSVFLISSWFDMKERIVKLWNEREQWLPFTEKWKQSMESEFSHVSDLAALIIKQLN